MGNVKEVYFGAGSLVYPSNEVKIKYPEIIAYYTGFRVSDCRDGLIAKQKTRHNCFACISKSADTNELSISRFFYVTKNLKEKPLSSFIKEEEILDSMKKTILHSFEQNFINVYHESLNKRETEDRSIMEKNLRNA